MPTMRDSYEQVKLQFGRLNREWSPTGDLWSSTVEWYLRQAVWNDRYPDRSVLALQTVRVKLGELFMEWNDHSPDPVAPEWNRIYGAACWTLDSLLL